MKNHEPTPLSVVLIAFDRISPFHLAVPCVVFGEAHPGCPKLKFKVCAAEPGTLRTSTGFSITIDYGLAALRRADIVIVPSWRDPAEKPPAQLLKALNAAHSGGAKIVGLCLGAYVLAEAGLLDGLSATTHWAYATDFSKRYPQINLDANVLYVEENGIVTSAGTAAGIDCCLYLLRQQYGSEVANSVARRLVVPPYRQGGQAQYIEQPIPESQAHSRISDLFDWVRENLHAPHTVDSVAEHVNMSRRTFTRQFKLLAGTNFLSWLQVQRLTYVQRLLESTDASIEAVAEKAGYGSPESLRLHFRRQFGLSPTEWRRQFRGE
ncbi:helix-turn-helix domain-containing protein [Undibacterium sp. Ji22W]|uniref:helix-turn-helix domain-containing protein n=1 Tax=Undibacterium sp. Ji22W TaxID=3413038 RepID=UPI003BF00912